MAQAVLEDPNITSVRDK